MIFHYFVSYQAVTEDRKTGAVVLLYVKLIKVELFKNFKKELGAPTLKEPELSINGIKVDVVSGSASLNSEGK